MVNFMIVERAAREAASQTLTDEKLEIAIANAIKAALIFYDQEKEKEKTKKPRQNW